MNKPVKAIFYSVLALLAIVVSSGPKISQQKISRAPAVFDSIDIQSAGAPSETSFDQGTPINDESALSDFQREIMPLIGRLGCNNRACHGSFQGQGGMQLSLFGYDFDADVKALTGNASSIAGKRIDVDSPTESLMLKKATGLIGHGGGKLVDVDSWEYELLRNWIALGAHGVQVRGELMELKIEPKAVVFRGDADQTALRVTAVWKNGAVADVTRLCRFSTKNDAVATVTEHGTVESTGCGDTHVIAFYDRGVATAQVIRSFKTDLETKPTTAANNQSKIDQFINRKLERLGIEASTICSDSEFLRRASIDICGTLPTTSEIIEFGANDSSAKRENKIEELLNRTTYAAWWATKLCDYTGCNPNDQAEIGQELATQWYMWMHARLKENTPYDQLVERVLLATSRESSIPFGEYCEEVSAYFRKQDPVNFSERKTMPHYWTRRSVGQPKEKALAVAHNFLGIRLQCAQCHKHPFDRWTTEDFNEFSRFFKPLRFGVQPGDQSEYRNLARKVGANTRSGQGFAVGPEQLDAARSGKTMPWRELYVLGFGNPTKLNLLGEDDVQISEYGDPRIAIMEWMRKPDNPWFAKAFVNRVWASYFHRGIIEPADDLNLANPPSHPELLDYLTREFIKRGYDIKWLHREIATSQAYQRSWRPNQTNSHDFRNYSRAIPRRLPAEVIYDAIKHATVADESQWDARHDLTRRAVGFLSMRMAGTYTMQVFGKPERSLNCDCERVNKPALLQSVFMYNDPLISMYLDSSDWIESIENLENTNTNIDTTKLIDHAWLRTVSRFPSEAESQRAMQQIENSNSVAEALYDIMWALLNTKEFLLNH